MAETLPPSSFESPSWPSREHACSELTRRAAEACELPAPGRGWQQRHIASLESLLALLTDIPAAADKLSDAAHLVNAELAAADPVKAVAMAMGAALLATIDREAARLGREAEVARRPWAASVRCRLRTEIERAMKRAPAGFLTDDTDGRVAFMPDRWVRAAFDNLMAAPTLADRLGPDDLDLVERAGAGSRRVTRRSPQRDDLRQDASLKGVQIVADGRHLGADNHEAYISRSMTNCALTGMQHEGLHTHAPLDCMPEPAVTDKPGMLEVGEAELFSWMAANAESLFEDTEHLIQLGTIKRPEQARLICKLVTTPASDRAAIDEALIWLRDRMGTDRTRDQIHGLHQPIYAVLTTRAPHKFPLETEAGECAAKLEKGPGKAAAEWVRVVLRPRLRAAWR